MDIINKHKVKNAAIQLAALSSADKNEILKRIADNLIANKALISTVNLRDVARAEDDGLPAPVIKRLRMDERKAEAAAEGIYSLMSLDDPAGKLIVETELDAGLTLRKVSCPIGVIGVIFESRPDALVQIACLCLKSGNAVILKGGSEAAETNRLLTQLISGASTAAPSAAQGALQDKAQGASPAAAQAFAPEGWINQLETRAEINEILRMDDCVDLLIPRGSNAFVKYIMENTRIPVIGHSDGLCHCYVDAAANLEKAVRVVKDSKTQYAAVCNATETLLVHKDAAPWYLPAIWDALNGGETSPGTGGPDAPAVSLRGCAETLRILSGYPVETAEESDWGAEYLDYILSVKVVNSVDEAIDHINRYGSRHTDAIVTEDADAARTFFQYVDSANVYHNCSTRFSDGFRYGFGAEVGVSTSKIHARGPVGLEGLVTYKYLLSGDGHTVDEYERGVKTFIHQKK